jgi:hypothetical protein
MICRRLAGSLFITSSWLLFSPPAIEAQADYPRRRIVNIPYATAYGIGGFDVGDARVNVLSIPVSIPIRRFGQDRWGLRLRLTGSFGVYDVRALEDIGLDRIRTIAFLPGVEFQLPLSRQIVLRPYLDLGVGRDLEGHSSAYVAYAGVKSEFVIPWKRVTIGIVPRLEYTTSCSADDALDTDYAGASVKFDMRHPLWFRLSTAQPDFGVYFTMGYYMNEVNFEPSAGDPIAIATEFEFGVTAGSCPAHKLWFIPLPRLSVGYRWTDVGVGGVRISLGDRLLRCGR